MAMRLGGGNLRFEPVEHWEKLPAGRSFTDVAGVAVDARDSVYVSNRGEHPVVVFDRDGNLLRTSVRDSSASARRLGSEPRTGPPPSAISSESPTATVFPTVRLGTAYSSTRRSRNALPMTDTELNVIAALAIIGLRRSPVTG